VPPGPTDAFISLMVLQTTRRCRNADRWASDVVPAESPALAQAVWDQDLEKRIEANTRAQDIGVINETESGSELCKRR
jgi:hypothetical protein